MISELEKKYYETETGKVHRYIVYLEKNNKLFLNQLRIESDKLLKNNLKLDIETSSILWDFRDE